MDLSKIELERIDGTKESMEDVYKRQPMDWEMQGAALPGEPSPHFYYFIVRM